MSSILDLDGDFSSDENDGDYVPPSGAVHSDSSGEDDASLDEGLEPDEKPKSRKRKNQKDKKPDVEVAPALPPVDEKKRAENIWLDFLSDVSKNSPAAKKPPVPEVPKISETKNEKPELVPPKPELVASKPELAAPKPELAAPKSENSSKSEIFEFAGETFTVSNETVQSQGSSNTLEANSEEPQSEALSPSGAALPKKRGGIESILGSISNKKKKLSTLEKTLYDWKSFKKDEGLYEDLEKYNKGKGGFIERQRFLQRSDLRSFEIEKSMRQSKRK